MQQRRDLFHRQVQRAQAALPQIKSDQNLEQPATSDSPERHQVFTLNV